MDSTLNPPISELIVASRNLRARLRDLRVQVQQTHQRASAAVARARRIQLMMLNSARRLGTG
jgi:hypothetical protein